MKAMLIWSDGLKIDTHIFEDKDGKTGYERAVEEMHKEYDDHNCDGDASEEYGAFRGEDSCHYDADGKDFCTWHVVQLPEEEAPVIPNVLSQADRCELFGILIDTVEDWLDEKGVTNDMIPNDEREDEDAALIYGSDYDYLADRFSAILGIERDEPEDRQHSVEEITNMLPDDVLEAAYEKRKLQYRIQNAKNHAELEYEIGDEDAESNSMEERPRICGIMFKESKDDDYSYLGELRLTEEEENAIQQILMNHETEGCSVRGTWQEVIEEITQ